MADKREAVQAVRALATARATWTVLIDGRSGAGKSTLARSIVRATGAALIRLDDLYPGWDGLAAGAEAVRRGVLVPRRTGRPGSWRRWDWEGGHIGKGILVPLGGGLICEGSGVLTYRSAPLADLTMWVELADPERKRRALLRDGEVYAPHWDRWAAQEAVAIAREHPVALADRVVDGRHIQQGFSGRAAGLHYGDRP